MASSKDRDTFVNLAKFAEQAERNDEMVEAMTKVAKLDVELTVEERNLNPAYELVKLNPTSEYAPGLEDTLILTMKGIAAGLQNTG